MLDIRRLGARHFDGLPTSCQSGSFRQPNLQDPSREGYSGSDVTIPDRLSTFFCAHLFQIGCMINKKRIVVVMPAYNAEQTLEATVRELPEAVDECVLVDDHSTDATVEVARRLGLTVEVHEANRGYG